ncbi:uncharacterized protein HD556DRAFT_1305696 [Suillus plorans]|uniref:Uncharacterized protein n=1 Tax=Suillus plorans TaxID=116603 RepID=A0A9P7DMV2_9AGAM|nr:uncharacterized protein HD556DRAFT_1305696 [Suillus plorans]KAG1798821.1 hypothetical protein HD556DRAFT_1305696 [Suillus plorans]
MNNDNYANANGELENQHYEIPQRLLRHTPRPREVVFMLTRTQLAIMYITWAVARRHVHQRVYQPELPFPPYPPHPVWSDERESAACSKWRWLNLSIYWDLEVLPVSAYKYLHEVFSADRRGVDKFKSGLFSPLAETVALCQGFAVDYSVVTRDDAH